ncbi:MAG TPA: hypothetical protein DHV58_00180, partial [Erythrobacter sp.]|nr:hypothetical protein [Erythrobacter sp.]
MRTIVAALALGMAGSMASAAADGSDPPEPLETFQRSEDRLFRVGYRLATANAAFCDQTVRVSGLLIHDAGSYNDPAAVRRQFGLLGDIGVQAVAPLSPADAAGIRQNDTILAIAGRTIEAEWPLTNPRWQRVSALRDVVDDALSRGTLDLSLSRAETPALAASIIGVPACPTRFELVDSKSSAAADG